MSLLLANQGAGSTFTLTAESGTYALSGQTAGLLAGRVLAAEFGTYNLTGQDAGLKAGRVLAAEFGSYTLSGQDAALITVGESLLAETGFYVLTGQDADLVFTPAATVTETFSGGWERHPYIRGPKRVRYKFKDEEIPAPVVEIVENLAAQITSDAFDRDLEIALRLRLRNQEIAYHSIYLLLLEQEFKRIKTRQRQENEAVELLLLH